MGVEWVFLPILTVLGVITIIVELSRNKNLQKYDLDANSPIIINIPKKRFTGGYSLGQIKEKRENKNGTYYVKYAPIDVTQGEDVPRPPMQDFIVLKSNLRPIEVSDRRQFYIVTSSDQMDYPKNMRETQEGRWMSHEGLVADLENSFGSGYQELRKAIEILLTKWSGGELSTRTIKDFEEQMDKIKELYSKIPKPDEGNK